MCAFKHRLLFAATATSAPALAPPRSPPPPLPPLATVRSASSRPSASPSPAAPATTPSGPAASLRLVSPQSIDLALAVQVQQVDLLHRDLLPHDIAVGRQTVVAAGLLQNTAGDSALKGTLHLVGNARKCLHVLMNYLRELRYTEGTNDY